MTQELLLYVTVWATQLAYFQPNMVYASGSKNTFDDCSDLLVVYSLKKIINYGEFDGIELLSHNF